MKTDLKLQRRDTPHYLKNKRVNLTSEPDEAAAAILSQVLAKTKEASKPKDNIRIDRVRSCQRLKHHQYQYMMLMLHFNTTSFTHQPMANNSFFIKVNCVLFYFAAEHKSFMLIIITT